MSSLQVPSANPNAVISPNFCAPHPIQLSIKKKVYFFAGHEYEVEDDTNGRLLFKIKWMSGKLVIFDAAGNPIVTLGPKLSSNRCRWHVFRGESKENRDMIFSARFSSVFHIIPDSDVFLPSNTAERVCDFKLKTPFSSKTWDIYGPSSSLIAQMKSKISAGSIFLGKIHFMVTVNPNVDHVFIVALILIHFVNIMRRRGMY
ncbi:PREDICTED: protein LURP-one-related 10-like [Ipomoea nil]|uniref:protein LURP-one-related 10-like n=1 Tax=Ipomoea nil TaxID=35883 RepID=UPI000901332D|nr:PREDICTED: protein LURP-one-related 10-like [Ipomoea nil]